MGKIVYMKKYVWGKNIMENQTNKRIEELLKEIREKREKTSNKFDAKYIDYIAGKIREIIMGNNFSDPTPVVKVAEAFGIPVYKTKTLGKNRSGNIYIRGKECKMVNKDKIILIDEHEVLGHQRFVIAHELGHYLFDYIGSIDDDGKTKTSYPYIRNSHKGIKEQNANRFAAALLMPKEMFIIEHNNAVEVDNRKIYVIKYLAYIFQVKESSIIKRIAEVGGEINSDRINNSINSINRINNNINSIK